MITPHQANTLGYEIVVTAAASLVPVVLLPWHGTPAHQELHGTDPVNTA